MNTVVIDVIFCLRFGNF